MVLLMSGLETRVYRLPLAIGSRAQIVTSTVLGAPETFVERGVGSAFGRTGAFPAASIVLRMLYAKALAYIYDDVQMPPPTRDDCREAINILTDVLGRARRVLGPSHPITTRAEDWLQTTRLVVRGLEFRWLVQESM